MALSKDQLTVQVELDSKGAVKGFKVLNDEISSLNESMNKATHSSRKLDDSLKFSNVNAVISSIRNLTETLTYLDAAVKTLPDNLILASYALKYFNRNTDYKSVDKLSDSLLNASRSVQTFNDEIALTKGQSELAAKGIITYEKSLTRLQNGLDEILTTAAVSVAGVTVAMSALNTDAIPRFISGLVNTSSAAEKTVINLGIMTKELKNVGITSLELTKDTATSGILLLKKQSDEATPAIKTLASTIKGSFASISTAYQNTQAAQLSFIDTIKKVYPSISSSFIESAKAVRSFVGYFSTVFSQGGLFSLIKEFGINLATVFSASSLSSIANTVKDSFSSIFKSVTNVGLIFRDIAKDIPNSMNIIRSGFASLPDITKGFIDFGNFLIQKNVNTSLLTMAESSLLLKNGLVVLGTTLLGTESTLAKFTGVVAIAAGILLGGFAYAVKMALTFIGDLVAAIGSKLITSMEAMEQKFQKAQVALTNFNFTIAGMNREFGDGVGTLQSWSKLVDELSQKTLITASDARKMATEIMTVGQSLGLSRVQMEDLIKLIPNYVKAGDDAFDVTVSFLQALSGSPQGLLKYAVHLSDAGVEHSKFAKQANLSMEMLTEEQKVQARFNALMEQSAPIMGKAAIQLTTIAGSQQILANSIEQVQIKIGSQNALVTALNMTLANFVKSLSRLPAPLFDIIGVMQDLGGVTLFVLGNFIAWALPISAAITLLGAFNTLLTSNAFAQLIVSKALTFTNVALGGQAIAVTSSATAWAGLGTLLKTIATSAIIGVGHAITGAATAMWGFTTALLANPLFWKAAAVVGGIVLIIAALKRIEEETKIFSQLISDLSYPFQRLISAFSEAEGTGRGFGDVVGVVIRKAVDIAVIAIGGFINGIFTLTFAMSKLLDVVTFGQFEIFAQSAEYALDKMNSLSNTMETAATDLSDFSSKAYASVPALDAIGKGAEEARSKLNGLNKELITSNEKALITAQAQGHQIEALLLSKVVAEDKMKLAKELSEKQNITREIYKIDADIAQFPINAFREASQSYNQLKIQNLEQLNTIASIREAGALKAKEALKPLTEKIKEIKLLPSTESTKAALDQLKALYSATQQAINDDVISKVEDLKSAKENAELSALLTYAQIMGDTALIAEAQYQKDLKEYQKLLSDKLISEQAYEDAKKKLQQKKTATEEEPKKKKLNDDIKAASDMIGAAMSGADALVSKSLQAVGKTIAVTLGLPPEMGDMVAGLINFFRQGGEALKGFAMELVKIVIELPQMIAEGIVGLVDGLMEGVMNMLSDPAKLGKIFSGIISFIPKVITTLAKAIPKLLKLLLDPSFWIELASQFVRAIWDSIVEMFYAIGDMLADIFSGDIFKGPDEGMKKMGQTVEAGIKYATNAVTGVSDQLFGVMEDAALTGQTGGKGKGGGGAEAIGKANKETSRVWKWVQDWIVKPLSKLGTWIYEQLFLPVIKTISEIVTFAANVAVKAFEVVGDLIAATFAIAGDVLKAVWDVAIAYLKLVWDSIVIAFETAIDYLKAIWDGIINLLKVTWDTIISVLESVFEYIKTVFMAIWDTIKTIFATIWENAKAAFNVIVQVFKSVWDVAKAIFDPIITAFKGIWDYIKSVFDIVISVFKAMWDFVKTLFDDPIKAFKDLWESAKEIFNKVIDAFKGIWETIKNIFSGIVDAFKAVWEGAKKIFDAIISAFSTAWEGIKNIFSSIGEGFSKSWDKLKDIGGAIKDGLVSAFNSIGDMFANAGAAIFNGLKKAWDSTASFFSDAGSSIWNAVKSGFSQVGDFFSKLFKIPDSAWGKGTVEKFIGIDFPWLTFSEGGNVPGTAQVFGDSRKNDTVPALLSPGEFVIPRSKLQDDDNLKLLSAIMNGGTQKKAYGEWIEKAKTLGVQHLGFGEWVKKKGKQIGGAIKSGVNVVTDVVVKAGDALAPIVQPVADALVKAGDAIAPIVQPIVDTVKVAGEWIGDTFIPDDLKKIWDAAMKFIKNMDLKKFVLHPIDTIKEAIKGAMDFLSEPLKKLIGMNSGGLVPGFGMTDTVPAMLTPGEFVINRNATQALGAPLLNRLNAGMIPSGTDSSPIFNITLNIETSQAIDDNFIRNKLVPTIKQEIKTSSLRGEFLVSAKGIR